MREKQERQRIIREVIEGNRVANQEELSVLLEKRGLTVAQATLSRDIRDLRISKIHDESGYFYRLPSDAVKAVHDAGGIVTNGIESLEFSGSMAVIKTRPGYANMIGALIDGNHLKEIIGTVAGDDTVLVITREGYSHDEVAASLGKIFKGIEKKRAN